MSITDEMRGKYVIVYLWNPLTVPDTIKGALFRGDHFVKINWYSPTKAKASGIRIIKGKQRTAFLSRLGLMLDKENATIRKKKR